MIDEQDLFCFIYKTKRKKEIEDSIKRKLKKKEKKNEIEDINFNSLDNIDQLFPIIMSIYF